jgi:uncharacterized protein (DUF427 family)
MDDAEALARAMWKWRGQVRPAFAKTPAQGQESVWDYPRPPRIEDDPRRVVVRLGKAVVAETQRARRVLETAAPPTFYLPPEDVDTSLVEDSPGSSFCEWKGEARYWTVVARERRVNNAAWSYDRPLARFAAIAGWFAFYPALLDCSLDGEVVRPQPGRFYGGWVTDEIVGPFKGEPGSGGW